MIGRLTVRVKSHGRHRVHIRLRNILDDHRNIPIPRSNRLVVRGGDESPVLVDKGDGVDGTEMLIVFLGDFSGSEVVLPTREVSTEIVDARRTERTWMIFLSCIPARKMFCLS